MNFDEYQEKAMLTAGVTKKEDKVLNAVMGLSGESGEITDLVKKFLFQGHSLDRNMIIEELGDIMWYVSLACDAFDITMEDVAKINIDKLSVRYPNNRFEAHRSRKRDRE